MATAAEIRDRALRRLGVLAFGQTASPEAADAAETAFSEYYASLAQIGLAVWAFSGDVPDILAEPVINGLCQRLLNDFSVSNERYQRIMADASQSEAQIRRMIGNEYVYKPVDILDF